MEWSFGRKTAERLLADAGRLLNAGQAEAAAQRYREAWERHGNGTAAYNLGTLYALGRGVPQDFIQAARCYADAREKGEPQADKLWKKCLLDFAHQNLDRKTPRQVYEDLAAFFRQTAPAGWTKDRLCDTIYDLAAYDISKRDFGSAARLARAGAEFGGDGRCQNLLGVLYNRGAGVKRNDLVALYWFDLAADRGVEAAGIDRDGILNAYRRTLSREEFSAYMGYLADWCGSGTEDVAKNQEKQKHWRSKV